MRDLAVLFVKEQKDKEDKKKKEASDKKKGEMQKAAMELIGSKCMHDSVWNVSMIDLS